VLTDLYVPSTSEGPPPPNVVGEGSDQAVEVVIETSVEEGQEEESSQEPSVVQATEDESEERLVQGSDGGFLRVFTKKKRKIQAEDSASEDSKRPFVEEAYKEGISNPRKSADEAVERDATPESTERISRAARRKALRDEMKKRVVAEEALLGKNPYRRRRMW
jgi:hypothetical protein